MIPGATVVTRRAGVQVASIHTFCGSQREQSALKMSALSLLIRFDPSVFPSTSCHVARAFVLPCIAT